MQKTLLKKLRNSFQKKVYEKVRRIPKGEVLTYEEVAILAGKPKAFRVVGNILNKNRDYKIPCHRVIKSDGSIGGYNRGLRRKACLLKKEGVVIKRGRVVN
jgi:O-6-methylguanine DNA methyltransferase